MPQSESARRKRVERVTARDTQFFVEVVDTGGAQPVGIEDTLSFEGVRDTVEAISQELADVWRKVKPTEATVEFGLSVTAKSGKLAGLLVDADGAATFKITLRWASSGS